MSNTTILKVKDAGPLEGLLYEIQGEDEPIITFDCEVWAETEDGRQFVHKTFFADGRKHRATRAMAREFAEKVKARGEINLAHWELFVDRSDSLEERWDGYAREEQMERAGYVTL